MTTLGPLRGHMPFRNSPPRATSPVVQGGGLRVSSPQSDSAVSHVHEDQVFCVVLLPTVAGRLLRPHEGGCRVLDTVEPPTGKVALAMRMVES